MRVGYRGCSLVAVRVVRSGNGKEGTDGGWKSDKRCMEEGGRNGQDEATETDKGIKGKGEGYRVWVESLVEVEKKGDKSIRRTIRYKHKIRTRRYYSHNTVVESNFVLSGFFYARKHPDSKY
jgi:hypothetical protein